MTDRPTGLIPPRVVTSHGMLDEVSIYEVNRLTIARLDNATWWIGAYRDGHRIAIFLESRRDIVGKITEDELGAETTTTSWSGANAYEHEAYMFAHQRLKEPLTIDNLRQWHIEQADYWADVAADHKERRDWDKFDEVMRHAGFHRHLARMIQEGFLPDDD